MLGPKTYRMTGTYAYDGKVGELEAELIIRGSSITGKMTDLSARPELMEREVSGSVLSKDGKTVLEILVNVPGDKHVNIKYSLERNYDDENIDGLYSGFWKPVEKHVNSRVTGGPFETRSGMEYYTTRFTVVEPKPEDDKEQSATAMLRRVA